SVSVASCIRNRVTPAGSCGHYLRGHCGAAQGNRCWLQAEVVVMTAGVLTLAVLLAAGQPQDPPARGVALARGGRLAEAATLLLEATPQRPESADAFHNLGVALAQQGRTEEAIRALRQALALEPGRADSWQALGLALLASGQSVEAAQAYAESLRLSPRD